MGLVRVRANTDRERNNKMADNIMKWYGSQGWKKSGSYVCLTARRSLVRSLGFLFGGFLNFRWAGEIRDDAFKKIKMKLNKLQLVGSVPVTTLTLSAIAYIKTAKFEKKKI